MNTAAYTKAKKLARSAAGTALVTGLVLIAVVAACVIDVLDEVRRA